MTAGSVRASEARHYTNSITRSSAKFVTIGSLSKLGRGHYEDMTPSFTNPKRQKMYEKDTRKGGFKFINWDIEEELWRFQREIETKYARSQMNIEYKFPLQVTPNELSSATFDRLKRKNFFIPNLKSSNFGHTKKAISKAQVAH
jgi:hypothetical protein